MNEGEVLRWHLVHGEQGVAADGEGGGQGPVRLARVLGYSPQIVPQYPILGNNVQFLAPPGEGYWLCGP